MSTIEALLGEAEELPALPEAATRAMRLLDDPDSGLDEVSRAIELDASMSSRIVRLANSALFGAREPASSLRGAIVRLGAREVRSMITTVAVLESVPELPAPYDVRSFWMQGLATALLSRRLRRGCAARRPHTVLI